MWFDLNTVNFIGGLLLDWIRLLFLRVVCLISRGVISYCTYYIDREKDKIRFVWLLVLFIGSIVLIVVRPNLIRLLLG